MRALGVAAAIGLVHAAFSAYWGLDGGWLVETLGTRLGALAAGRKWVLLPVAAVKATVALWPLTGRWRPLSWLAALALVGWGGLNTVVGHLVLAGVVVPDGGYDRPGMVGHAWLWDPLFLAWGLALGIGLRVTRGGLSEVASRV